MVIAFLLSSVVASASIPAPNFMLMVESPKNAVVPAMQLPEAPEKPLSCTWLCGCDKPCTCDPCRCGELVEHKKSSTITKPVVHKKSSATTNKIVLPQQLQSIRTYRMTTNCTT